MPDNETSCDLLVIGTGMAGNAAALFAAQRGIDTLQAGLTSGISFASGLLDLMGVHPVGSARVLDDPWRGIEALRHDEPGHPYGLVTNHEIETALQRVLRFFAQNGYPYVDGGGKNFRILTPAGTLKPTYAVPHTMADGPRALAQGSPCLIVGFTGLKGFSSRQIALSLAHQWPGLRPLRIDFPGASTPELYTEHLARALDGSAQRLELIQAILPRLGDARAVALPAVLGLYRTEQVMREMREGLGVAVFEIPTMLPAVTGLRLQELFERHLPALGVRSARQKRVLAAHRLPDYRWVLEVGGEDGVEQRITARSVVLCSGRFLGRGLHAERRGVRETIFNLPVTQPASRSQWHHKDLLNPSGHGINRAGIAVDSLFRPVDAKGNFVYANVFAAGSILAHQDWVRQKCGSGMAIATAFKAVQASEAYLKSAIPHL